MASFQPLGFSIGLQDVKWEELLAMKIFDETGDSVVKNSILTSWIPGWGTWDVQLIDSLNKLSTDSLLPGADQALYLSANGGVSLAVAQSFLKNVDMFRGTMTPGAISVAKTLVSKFSQGAGNIVGGAGDTAKSLPIVLIVLAAGVAGYLIFAGKKGVKLTP
jgi:hypothetical protein